MAGGQLYYPDENRYLSARRAVDAVFAGEFIGGLRQLHSAEHFFYKILAVIPAAIEKVTFTNPKIPALFFSFFSLFNIWLFWKLCSQLGADDYEALISATLLALSTSFLYYTRHLLPYDVALTFGFLALLFAFTRRSGVRDSCLCGIFSSLTFLTYNGYWTFGAFALIGHCLYRAPNYSHVIRRALISGACFVAPIAAIIATSIFFSGAMHSHFVSFSQTVTQGTFEEGWSLPIAYLWHSEHFIFVILTIALVFTLVAIWRGERRKHVIIGVAGVLFIYGTLVVFSMGLKKFVVYGRLVRQCIPFFCIVTAYAFARLRSTGDRGTTALRLVYIIIVIQAGVNFYRPMTQLFPPEFTKLAQPYIDSNPAGEYAFLYLHHIFPTPEPLPSRAYEVLLKRPHPLQYFPNQYQGYTPEWRDKIRATDFSMRLIRYSN